MQNITPFQFEAHQLRVITDDQGTPWFNATDVCDALDIPTLQQAVMALPRSAPGSSEGIAARERIMSCTASHLSSQLLALYQRLVK